MWSEKENVITEAVKAYLDKREKTRQWISIGLFILCMVLALWIAYVTKDVQDINNLRREAIIKELQTDSLKNAKIREFDKKYDESLKQYYKDIGKNDNGTSNK